MSGRNAFATPTNVYPRNGAPVVFDSNDQILCSFTNNSDSIAFVRYDFFDATTDEWLQTKYCKWFDDTTWAITSNRGDRYIIGFDKHNQTTGATFRDGYHYKYNITLFGCQPHLQAERYIIHFPKHNFKLLLR